MWNSKHLFLLCVVALCAAPVAAQTVVGDRLNIDDTATVSGATELNDTLTITPAAPIALFDAAVIRQRAAGATKYVSEWFVDSQDGTTVWNSYDTVVNAYTPSLVRALSLGIQAPTSITGTLGVTGNTSISGLVGHPDFASQTSKWRITADGGGDFRYLYTDELHAKAFIADLEQALAGGQIIAKSVAVLAVDFTCPASPGVATLVVEDLPGAADMEVFQANDYVVVRAFARSGGALTIADCVGVVSAPDTTAAGTQSWTFTRGAANAGTMTGGTIVPAKNLVIDYGVSGNGYYEVNAIDGAYGANSPYAQIVTWATSPVAANRSVRTRFGKLTGITSQADEFGILAGTYAATNGQYFRASNSAFELHGIDLLMWEGTTNTVKLSRSGPSFALGSPVPSAYSTGTGVWMGNDAGTYKFRVGVPGGAGAFWDGTTFAINGEITATTGVIGGWTIGATTLTGGNATLASSGNLTLGTVNDVMRASADDATYRLWVGHATAASAPFRVTKAGALTATNATITGAITATSGSFTGDGAGVTNINGGNIQTDTITASQIAANAITTSELNADSVTSAKIVAGTIVASDIAAGTITADRLNVTTLSAITANLGTITAGHINGATAEFGGGAVDLNSSGISFTAGTGSANQVKWSDGSHIESSGGNLNVEASAGGNLTLEGDGITINAGTGDILVLDAMIPNTNNSRDLGTPTLQWRQLYTVGARVSSLVGTGTRAVCAEADGDLVVCP